MGRPRYHQNNRPKAISCPSPKEEPIPMVVKNSSCGCNTRDAKISVIARAEAMISIESATVKMKEQSKDGSLRIHGTIAATTWDDDIYLYQRTVDEPDIIAASPEGSFDLPLTLPDWSLAHHEVTGFQFALYEGHESKSLLHKGSMCIDIYDDEHDNDNSRIISANGRDKLDEPIEIVIDNDRANFTFCFTRINFAYTVYVSFRVFDCDNKFYDGECNVSGTIGAKQHLWNGVSRGLTLFDSSSRVEVPTQSFGKRSIPLLRPVLVVPVQTQKEVDAKEGGYVELEFDLELGTGDANTTIKGKANLILQPRHKPGHRFYIIPNEISSERKNNVSVPDEDDGITIRILVTPFYEYNSRHRDEGLRD